MLHILFIILKILGILLLVILGLLFLCLLAVLFVPIRYRGNGSYHSIKDFGVHLHIHWLLHAVSLRIAYENGLRYAVKLFGFRIFGSESEEKDTESGRVREGTQAADSDELEFVNAQEKTEDDDLDTGELILRAEAASEPAPASVRAKAPTAPEAAFGRYFFFCSSVPFFKMISLVRVWTAISSAVLAHTLAISMIIRHLAILSMPVPP